MQPKTQIETCQKLASQVAPELETLHIADSSVFEDLGLSYHCLGWSTPNCPEIAAIADRIPGYDSPGAVIALNAEQISLEAPAGRFEPFLAMTMVHEIAHVVPAVPTELRHDTGAVEFPVEIQVELLQRVSELPAPQPTEAGYSHGWQFIRRAIHLWARAEAAGYEVALDRLLGPEGVFTSPAQFYMTPLVGEIVRMKGETFASIEACEPPKDFMEIWNQDLENYEKFYK